MKSILIFATFLVLVAVPSLSMAATTVYSGPEGGFVSTGNFAVGWGTGAGGAFACDTSNICRVAQTIIYIINFVLVPLIFAIAFIVFLWGVFLKYIYSHGDSEKVSEGHKLILWGLVAFVVMISLWGLVNVVANTFGLAGFVAPTTPRSY